MRGICCNVDMSSKIKNKHRLRKKEIREISTHLQKTFSEEFFNETDVVESGYLDHVHLFFINGSPDFMEYNDEIFFTMGGLLKHQPKKRCVVVDMGAVQYVTNGADVMTPGIVDVDVDIQKNDQVWICDEHHHKPLAVGVALMSGEQMITEKKGKAVKTIHHIGDHLWKQLKST